MENTKTLVIVGAGIVGLGAAWHLAKQGWKVRVLEQHFVGAGASGGAIGALVPYPPQRDYERLPSLQRRSIGEWPNLAAALELETGLSAGWRPIERWQICKTEDQFKQAQDNEIETEGLWKAHTPEEAKDKDVLVNFGEYGAALCFDTACVCVPQFLQTLSAAAEGVGVEITEYCTVTGIEGRDDGVVIQTKKETIQADKVLVAAGAWAAKFHLKLAEEIPAKPALGQALKLKMPGHGLTRMIRRGRIYLIPEGDTILVGSTLEPKRGFERMPTEKSLNKLLAEAIDLVPSLAKAELVATWTGLRPKSENGEPVIGWVTGLPHVAVAAGHYGIGYGLLPWSLQEIDDLFALRR